MFSVDEREEVLNCLVDNLSALDELTGLIIVGNGALGFRDKYSDIDIALVYNESYSMENVFDLVINTVSREYKVATVLNQLGRNLQVILLDNYLEIDIGYYTKESITARRKSYKVVFDKSGTLEEKMNRSWEENSSSFMGTTSNVDIQTELYRADANLWYNLIHTVNSFLRDEKYRCYFELEELRRNLISLMGKRLSLETKRYRDVHSFGETDIKTIETLFVYPKTNEELKFLMSNMVNLFYKEFNYWGHTPRLESDFLQKYVFDNLG